mmetsp:Transcript_30982/g.46191  ORF Transcript_30982/g.46191 Transcript_30982/m.46191 type:complete len:85 (+) Transcript_30982:767-1021(+)
MRRNSLSAKKNPERKQSGFVPKKSKKHVAKVLKPADDDTWVEHIVIIDEKSKKLRSYFKSEKTNKCIWDEPPTGASKIILASEK